MASKLPRTFTSHSQQEAKILDYLDRFDHTFQELHPQRRPLFLTPKNECGVRKFVCTTLRPTQLAYPELYDMDGALEFVSNYLTYEPLEHPVHMPEFLPSPTSVLSWQVGFAHPSWKHPSILTAEFA